MQLEPDRNQRIREIAYAIWESEGRPQGRAVEHWLKAERAFAGKEPGAKRTARKPKAAGEPGSLGTPSRTPRPRTTRKKGEPRT